MKVKNFLNLMTLAARATDAPTPQHNPPGGTLSLGCTHLHPCITPLAARSRLTARATDAKICLWQIKHRRVQTAAVGLCRGVYVFIGRVQPVLRHTLSCGLCSGVYRQPQWVYVGVFMYSLAGWELCPSSGLCSGVGRQPQWVYVGVFVYSLAG